jgi:hypothetical protein
LAENVSDFALRNRKLCIAHTLADVCLGYNTLHNVPSHNGDDPQNIEMHEDIPHGKRVWQWLILCDQKTVITIHEDPFPENSNGNGIVLDSIQHRSLGIIRRNLLNCFKQCSKAGHRANEPALLKLPIRTRMGDTGEEATHRPTDVPGLLFYYLFDDWINTYSLIARRNHCYAAELNRLVSLLSILLITITY